MKARKLLDQFEEYCAEHPEYRFWQALRNWAGVAFLYASNDLIAWGGVEDTFYWNKRNPLNDTRTKKKDSSV